jgi:hypothetical protein
MSFKEYNDRNWLILIVLGFLGLVLFIHGGVILWNLRDLNNLFTTNSVIDSLGSISELIVGSILVLLAVFQDSVLEAFDGLLNSMGFHS